MADGGDGFGRAGGVQGQRGRGRGTTLAEQTYGVAVSAVVTVVHGERSHLDTVLDPDPDGLSAGGEDGQLRCCGEEFAHQQQTGGQHAFAAVEDEQDLPTGQPLAQRLDRGARIVVEEVDRVADRRGEQPVVVEVGQVDPPDPVGVLPPDLLRDAQRQSALPDSATTGERDASLLRQRRSDCVEFAVAADKAGRHHWEVA